MADLIDRQKAIDFIDAGHLVNPNEPRWSDNEVVNFLKSRPSADAVEVVRCAECKHYFTSDLEKAAVYGAECTIMRMRMLPHEYCSRGGRE